MMNRMDATYALSCNGPYRCLLQEEDTSFQKAQLLADLPLPPPFCRDSGNGMMIGSVHDAVWLEEFSQSAIIFASYA